MPINLPDSPLKAPGFNPELPAHISALQGSMPWRGAEQLEIAREADKLAATAQAKGVHSKVATQRKQEQLAAIKKREKDIWFPKRGPGEALPLTILPGFSVEFAPQELIDISKDFDLASQVYKRVTGIAHPSKETIKSLQQTVNETYPDLEEQWAQKIAEAYRKEVDPFSFTGQEQRRKTSEQSLQKKIDDLSQKIAPIESLIDHYEASDPDNPQLHLLRKQHHKLYQQKQILLERARYAPNYHSTWEEEVKHRREVIQEETHPYMRALHEESLTSRIAQREISEALKKGELTSVDDVQAFLDTNFPDLKSKPALLDTMKEYFADERVAELQGSQTALPKVEKEKLLKRLEYLHEVKQAEDEGVRVAPFNTTHREAEALLRRSQQGTEERGEDQKQRLKRLEETVPESSSIRGEWEKGSRALQELELPFEDQVQRHFNPYWEDASKARQALAEQQWKEKIEPSIKATYASMRLHQSPAMGQALTGRREKHEQQVRQEADLLKAQAYDSARQAAVSQQQKAIERATAHSHLSRQQQEQLLRQESVAQPAAAQQKLHEQMDAAAFGQLAQQKQQQQQHVLDEAQRQYEEERMEPLRILDTQSAISRGLQAPTLGQTVQIPASAAPPSAVNVLGGLLAAGQAMQQARAKGGAVRRRFANGGMPEWSQLEQKVQPDAYGADQQRIATQLENYQFDPVSNLMSRVSPYLLMSRKGQGHYAVGQGMAQHFDDQRQAYDKSMLLKEKAANLYDAMNQSLLRQKHFLADYETKKASHAEVGRYHDMMHSHHQAIEQENARHHQASEQMGQDALAFKAHEAEQKQSQVSKDDKKAIALEKDRIRDALKLQGTLDKLKGLYKKLDTGPNRGALAENRWDTTAALSGMGSVDEIAEARSMSNKLVTEIHQAMKNIPRAHAYVELIQSAKPNFRNPSATNLKLLQDLEEGPAMAIAHAKSELKERGMNEEEIDSYIHEMMGAKQPPSAAPTPKASSLKEMSTKDLHRYREQLQQMIG